MYKPNRLRLIDNNTMEKIHKGTVEVLERCGVIIESEQALEILKKNGAIVEGKNVKISEKLLNKALAVTPSSFTMCGLNEENGFILGEGQTRPRIDPAFGSRFYIDEKQGKRDPVFQDVIERFKIQQYSKYCDIAGGMPADPVDLPENGKFHFLLHEAVRHIDKPIRLFATNKKEFEELCKIYCIAAGHDDWLDNHISFILVINPLSPLIYEGSTLDAMKLYAEKHQAVCVQDCAMAGITSPMSLMGTAVLQNVEVLVGNVFVQLVNPGTSFIYGATSSRPNMYTGAYICASPDADLMNFPCLQMAKDFYKIPTRMMCGITDSKQTDAQSGMETMQTLMTSMLAGADLLHGVATMDGIRATSHEKFVMAQECFF